jgi:hypothetical protein
VQGDILYNNGSDWVPLSAGNTGETLVTQGAGANPIWADVQAVLSVNSKTGAVILDTDDIAEGITNEYYTEAKVSANTSVSTNTAKISADGSINTHSDVDITTVTPTNGQPLMWDGSNFTPQDIQGTLPSGLQGDVLYNNGTGWVPLSPGTVGEALVTQGIGINPVWADVQTDLGDYSFVGSQIRFTGGSTVVDVTNIPVGTLSLGAGPGIFTTAINTNQVTAPQLTISFIDSGPVKMLVTKEWVLDSAAPKTEIVAPTTWDGLQYNIDLSVPKQYTRIIDNTVDTLIFGLTFPVDAATVQREVSVIIDNATTNTVAISTMSFVGGTWNWSVGDPVSGIPVGGTMELIVKNTSNTAVKALTDVEA